MPDGKVNYCVRREVLRSLPADDQCGTGAKCVKQGTESYCTRPCHAGSTECPRTADCKDVGGGNFQCVSRTGSCVGDGTMCASASRMSDCQKGA